MLFGAQQVNCANKRVIISAPVMELQQKELVMVATFTKNISEKLQKRGHRVKVVASNALSVEDYTISKNEKKLPPVGIETINDVEVERVHFSTKNQTLWRYLYRILWYIKLQVNDLIRAFWLGPSTK